MEVVIHTVDHHESRFEVEDGQPEEVILQHLHPDKAFGHHHLVVQGHHGISMFVTSRVTYVELADVDRTEWPFYDDVFRAHRVSESEFGHYSKEEESNGCVYTELFLSDGKRLKLKLEPLEQGGIMPCASFVMDQLLSVPSLHVFASGGKHLLVNGRHIVRCDFRPCPGVPVRGWQAEVAAYDVSVR